MVSAEPYKDVARELQEKFHFKAVAITLREKSAGLAQYLERPRLCRRQFYDDVKI